MTTSPPTGSCPKCGATTLQEVKVKRSSVDRALAAEYLRALGGRETDDGLLTQLACQRCGCRWLPRTTQERQLRAYSGQLGPEAMKSAQADEAAKTAKAAKRAAVGSWKPRPLTIVLGVIIVILLILVVATG